tara:strand:- start:1000 stop:2388 length:1389 start_codon:yes stop_codon:yes gene_type:complete
MMNVIQIQDDLKNFSEDQLIKEMQRPSGNAPQFLVLSELNRRKRVKGEFAARQAQQQPTVAEEVVASAGVPQSGMMGMSEAMAPASVESGGIGAMMPKTMKTGGEVESYANGGLIEGIAESVNSNADSLKQLQGVSLQNAKLLQDMQNAGNPQTTAPTPVPVEQPTPMPITPRPITPSFPPSPFPTPSRPRPFPFPFRPQIPRRGKGYADSRRNMLGTNMLTGLGSIAGQVQPQVMAEGGVIKASNGFAGTGRSSADILKKLEERDKAKLIVDDDVENISEDVDTKDNKSANTSGKQGIGGYTIEPNITGLQATDSLEQQILDLQKGLQKGRNLDRNLAIAQAGLGILGSDKPLAQAIGEGGMKGLDAFREANKRYTEGVIDLINARAKLASGRKKGKLTAKDILSSLSKTREQLYGKPGDLSFVKPDLDPEIENRLKAQEQYFIKLLGEYGVDLPVATAIS